MLDSVIHKLNLAKIEAEDDDQRKLNADELISYYRGNHAALLEAHLEQLLSNSDLLTKYKALKACRNVTRSSIHKVTLIGAEPIVVRWGDGSGADQEAWDAWEDGINFPLFLQTVVRYTELLKTVIVHPYWDETVADVEGRVTGGVRLRMLTPNLVDVYMREENRDYSRPDVYALQYLNADKETLYEIWSVLERQRWIEDEQGAKIGEVEVIPADYGDPFVTFRRGYPLDSFWIEEGQEELLSVQRRVNYLLTQTNVQIFYGGMKIPIVEGAVGVDEPAVVLDPSVVFFTGAPDGKARTFKFDGPEVQSVVETIASEIQAEIDAVSESFDLPAGSMRASGGQARSGLSIELENAPLRDKARKDRINYTPTIRALVQQVAKVWRSHGSGAPGAEDLQILIPEPKFASAEVAKTEQDLNLIDRGLKKPSEFVRERNPDMDDDQALEYLKDVAEEKRMLKSGSSFAVPATPGFGGGLLAALPGGGGEPTEEE